MAHNNDLSTQFWINFSQRWPHGSKPHTHDSAAESSTLLSPPNKLAAILSFNSDSAKAHPFVVAATASHHDHSLDSNNSSNSNNGDTVELAPGHGRPISILCHGIFAHKNFVFFPKLSQEWPHAILRFDFTGAGESTGESSGTGYWDDVRDLERVVEYVISRGWKLDTVIGHSRGANVVLLYAQAHPTIPRYVVTLSPRFHIVNGFRVKFAEHLGSIRAKGGYETLMRVRGGVKGEKKMTWIPMDMDMWIKLEEAMHQLTKLPATLPILTVHGTQDEIIPVADASEFASRIPNHTLTLLQDADHNYKAPAMQSGVIRSVLEWRFDHQLGLLAFQRSFEKVSFLVASSDDGRVEAQQRVTRDPVTGGVWRDVGGYPVGNGRWVRPGRVFVSFTHQQPTSIAMSPTTTASAPAKFSHILIKTLEEISYLSTTPQKRYHLQPTPDQDAQHVRLIIACLLSLLGVPKDIIVRDAVAWDGVGEGDSDSSVSRRSRSAERMKDVARWLDSTVSRYGSMDAFVVGLVKEVKNDSDGGGGDNGIPDKLRDVLLLESE